MSDPIEVPPGFQKAIAKQDSLRPTPGDLADAIPGEFAVETIVPARGVNWPARKRIDYKGIRLRNADGTPNKTAKNLIDLHEPAARAGVDIVDKLHAGDYAERAATAAEREEQGKQQYLAVTAAERYAKQKKLKHAGRRIGDALENLWSDHNGTMVRLAFEFKGDSVTVWHYPA
jgi:hypothetical protein